MSDADRNVALLKDAYKKWGDSLGVQRRRMDENLRRPDFVRLDRRRSAGRRISDRNSRARDALKEYFAGLERDWQMIEYSAEHFVAQNDRVVMLGRCGWRYKKTGKVVWTRKANSWRFADGKAVEFYEYYDTAQVLAALS